MPNRSKRKAPLYLSVANVELAHAIGLKAFGGDSGVDRAKLASAVNAVENGYYSSLAEIAAAYAYGISQGHAFVDGNKRAAILAAVIFLRLNGVAVRELQTKKWYAALILVASGEMNRGRLSRHFKLEIARVRRLQNETRRERRSKAKKR